MARLNANLRLDTRLWRRDNPYDYFHQVAAALRAAGIGADATFTTDSRGHTDAWIELQGARDITWCDAGLWREGWHLSPQGGRLAGGRPHRLLDDIYPDPGAVVEAARAALEES